ncbi:hypothetical protein TcasGA2_TC004536 [Tribolium castaneum]|uniref:Uncharacterized protein n=1 Tax=Tribolium castaneum TaxID=7070 RepID=D6WB01_TRICA|nr:hypothetical protein TcasGA2_TC004536 [Tribolium castaneum]
MSLEVVTGVLRSPGCASETAGSSAATRVEAEHVEVVSGGGGGGRRLGQQEGGVVMMVVVVVVLCGQRVQAVHDHGGRRVGGARRGPYHRTGACSAGGTHCTSVLGTTRVEGDSRRTPVLAQIYYYSTMLHYLRARELLRNWSRRERYFTFMNGVSVPYLEVASEGRANREQDPSNDAPPPTNVT